MLSQLIRNDIAVLTPQLAAELSQERVESLYLNQVQDLTVEALQALGPKPSIKNIFLGGVNYLSSDAALTLASGYQSCFHFAGITELPEGTLRILATWRRGWFTFPNARLVSCSPELLRLAVLCDNLSMVRLLVQQGNMDPDYKFRDGTTPLLLAGMQHNSVLISELIELGANPNQVTHHENETLLHLAARSRSRGLIKYLIQHVDKSIRNCNGRTAYDEYDEPEDEVRFLLKVS